MSNDKPVHEQCILHIAFEEKITGINSKTNLVIGLLVFLLITLIGNIKLMYDNSSKVLDQLNAKTHEIDRRMDSLENRLNQIESFVEK